MHAYTVACTFALRRNKKEKIWISQTKEERLISLECKGVCPKQICIDDNISWPAP